MYIFLTILIVVACLLLIGVVLIQKSKGGGLASNYAGGNQYMGYRKTTDFIEKATWTLAIFVCLVSICATFTVKAPVDESAIKTAPVQTSAPAAAPATENSPKPAAVPAPAASQAPEAAPAAAK